MLTPYDDLIMLINHAHRWHWNNYEYSLELINPFIMYLQVRKRTRFQDRNIALACFLTRTMVVCNSKVVWSEKSNRLKRFCYSTKPNQKN